MSSAQASQRAIEWLESQLKDLSGIRNATSRDPSFKNWRQSTLTVMQRIWPSDQGRSERFRRIPFSPVNPQADLRAVRETYSRGCQEAARVLTGLIAEIRANGVPDASGIELPETQASEFQDGFPTVDLPAGDLGVSTSTSDLTDNMLADFEDAPPQGSDPGSPMPPRLRMGGAPPPHSSAAPAQGSTEGGPAARKGLNVKARLRDLLGFAQLSAKALAGIPQETPEPILDVPAARDPRSEMGLVPLGGDVGSGPQAPPSPRTETDPTAGGWPAHPSSQGNTQEAPASDSSVPEPDLNPSLSVIMSRPTTLRGHIEKVSLDSLISPTFRTAGGGEASEPAGPALPADPEASSPSGLWPHADGMPPGDTAGARDAEPAALPPAPTSRPALKLVRPVFDDPEFEVGPAADDMPGAREHAESDAPAARPAAAQAETGTPSSRVLPLPPLGSNTHAAGAALGPEAASRSSDPDAPKVDPEAFARATEDFMRSSPVLGATGRRVPRGVDDHGFGDPDAIAVASMVQDMARMGVPGERQAEVRARLMDLARRLERGELEWNALRKAVWFVMEYPELARRMMPVLLPWIDRAA